MDEKEGESLDLDKNSRAAKRLLLTLCCTAILFGVASVGPNFSPSVLGQGVSIPRWLMSTLLWVACTYLAVGFHHEFQKFLTLKSALLYDPKADSALDALIQLKDRILGMSELQSEVRSELEHARQLAIQATSSTPQKWWGLSNEDMGTIGQVSMTTIKPLIREAVSNISAAPYSDGDKNEVINHTLQNIDTVYAANIEAAIKQILSSRIERLTGQYKNELETIEHQSEKINTIEIPAPPIVASINEIHRDLARLSSSYAKRDRRMVQWYDGWLSYGLYSVVTILTFYDLLTGYKWIGFANACRLILKS